MDNSAAGEPLRRLGMEDAHIAALAAGQPVVFNLSDAAEGTLAVAQLVSDGKLRLGIYTIKNERAGLMEFLRFEERAKAAAKSVGASEIEILGLEIINDKLRDVLRRGGFSETTMAAPDELGGGTFNALSRVQAVD